MSSPQLVILGCGFTGAAVARRACAIDPSRKIIGTTRDPARAAPLVASGLEARVVPELSPAIVADLVPDGAHVLVAFPPDGHTDAAIAPALTRAAAVVYLSTTGVFGDARGRVDESTPTDGRDPKAKLRLDAERAYGERGAVILRPAGIYGPSRGLHLRVARGDYRVPEGGTQTVSRIHVDDLADLVLAAHRFAASAPRTLEARIFVVADDTPVPQVEVIRWLCARLNVPVPPSAPLSEVAATLRHDRAVDNARIKRALGVTLRFPSYREGFEDCFARELAARTPAS